MIDDRPLRHLVFPSFLQNHSLLRPDLDLADPQVFSRFVRYLALFFRGFAVTDSDLNNNAVFHNAAEHDDGIFWTAVRSGFLRRAARGDEQGNLLSQREVAEGLRRSSPERFGRIPPQHPVDLDRAFAQVEQRGDAPLVWTLRHVNQIFGNKLLGLLSTQVSDESRTHAEVQVIERMIRWAQDKIDTGIPFGAADVETQVLPSLTLDERDAWDAVWPIVLRAHAGNIPPVFRGQLAITGLPEADDFLQSAGPESGTEEKEIEAEIYGRGSGEWSVSLEFRRLSGEQLPLTTVNYERLEELSLEQIEELREAAAPDLFLDRRFDASGSSEAMAEGHAEYRDAAAEFSENLVRQGVLLTRKAQRRTLRTDLNRIYGIDDEAQLVAVGTSGERVVEYAMVHSFPSPHHRSSHVLACDFTQLAAKVDTQEARDFLASQARFYWYYKRPDYRIVGHSQA